MDPWMWDLSFPLDANRDWQAAGIGLLKDAFGGVPGTPYSQPDVPEAPSTWTNPNSVDVWNPQPTSGGTNYPTMTPLSGAGQQTSSGWSWESPEKGGSGTGNQLQNSMLTALRGLVTPPRPDVVKPSTPAVPVPRAGSSAQSYAALSKLLQDLQITPAEAAAMPKLSMLLRR